ncbi:MAG TPA: substrate-binding domain-containing protein, partial [bacterium]|nr:substrate-binding domain-containing protein [bacterium]
MSGMPKIVACLAGLALAGCAGDGPAGGAADSGPEDEGRIIRVSGAEDAYPLARALAHRFEETNPGYEVVFAPGAGTRGGVGAVSLGEADLGLVSRPLSEEERASGVTYLHLAHDIVVFVAASAAGVDSLTRDQLISVYSGAVDDWSEVGGASRPIAVLDRSEHTSIKSVLRRQLFGDSLAVTPRAMVLEGSDDMVTLLSTARDAIGYLSLGAALRADLDVVHLTVDGARPVRADVERGRYPYHRPLGFVVGESPSRAVMNFVRFVYAEEGRRTTSALGFLPVTMELVIAVLPEQDLLVQEHRYAPLVDYLGERLGLQTSVKLRLLPDYGTVIDELQAGRVNAAFLGSLAFAL